jgi:hypothetical protein
MIQNINSIVADTAVDADSSDFTASDALTEILRAGAQKMLKPPLSRKYRTT